ncbi:MAG: hypothetical protein NUV67_04670 [archaeon]|nr:hypothetical protein [archaeon]
MLNSFYDKFIFTSGLKYQHNNFYLLNLPFVIMPVQALAAIAEQNDAKLGKQIYYAVKDAVRAGMKKEFSVDFGVQGDKGLEFMETFFSASGWGKVQRTNMDVSQTRALVTVTNSPVAMEAKKAKMPVDTFIRGFLAGIFSNYFKTDVECVEVKCLALGEKECDFVVKPAKDFDFSKKAVKEQLDV